MSPYKELKIVIQNAAKSPAIKLKPAFPLFTVEQFLAPHLRYPCNEGFILGENPTQSALVITPVPVLPGAIVLSRPIGRIADKIVAVPVSSLTELYDKVGKISDLPKLLIAQISHFYDYVA